MLLSVITPVWNGESWILKALQSVPKRNDIEIIVVDDCSDDGTYEVVSLYKQYANQNIILLHNDLRLRPGGSINRGLDVAQGKFVVQLDSDDYLNTKNFNSMLELNRPEDLIFFPMQINDGSVWNPSDGLQTLCDHCCLYKRSLVGDTRHEKGNWATGFNFHHQILDKPHTEYYFNKIVYYYNYPREGSNLDLGKKGLLD